MGAIKSPVLVHTGYPDLDQIPPLDHFKRGTNKSIFFTALTVTLWSNACKYGILGDTMAEA